MTNRVSFFLFIYDLEVVRNISEVAATESETNEGASREITGKSSKIFSILSVPADRHAAYCTDKDCHWKRMFFESNEV